MKNYVKKKEADVYKLINCQKILISEILPPCLFHMRLCNAAKKVDKRPTLQKCRLYFDSLSLLIVYAAGSKLGRILNFCICSLWRLNLSPSRLMRQNGIFTVLRMASQQVTWCQTHRKRMILKIRMNCTRMILIKG